MEKESERTIHVLDLPQLYQRPSAPELLQTLADLRLDPLSWDIAALGGTDSRRRAARDEIPAYLIKIISSPLDWITGDADKECIWETAAQRLSERSGRAGMSAMTRSFRIPLHTDVHNKSEESLEIVLHEPAMTADNLGLKTWASSYLLAKRLPLMRQHIAPSLSFGASILELGAGTGLVGLAAAAVFGTRVILTDLPEIVPNLEKNADANARALAAAAGGASAEAAVLDWSQPSLLTFASGRSAPSNSFPLILSADPIYSPDHPELLVQTIEYHLSKGQDATVVIELPLRDAYAAERQDLNVRLHRIGLRIVQEGEEVGYDDWMDGDEQAQVRCQWSIWGRA